MKLTLLIIFFLCSVCARAQMQLAYNKGFEIAQLNKSGVWEPYDIKGAYQLTYSKEVKRSGNYSLLIDGKKTARAADDNDGGFFQVKVPPPQLKGKRKAKAEAWIKTDSHNAKAALWLIAYTHFGQNQPLCEGFADTLHDISGWQHVKAEITIPEEVILLSFGGLLNGAGKAWFDDFRLYIDDKEVTDIAREATPPSAKEIAWINKHAVRLVSSASNNKNTDLDSLCNWITNARLVGVGEPTHGTREAALFKIRLFKYLVKHKGFTTFMLEDELPECGLMNDYVSGRADSALPLLKKYFFPIGQNEEMLQLIEWMRSYNVRHDKKLLFRGIDMQSDDIAIQVLKRLAPLTDSTLSAWVNDLLSINDLLQSVKEKAERSTLKNRLFILTDSMIHYTDNNLTAYYSKMSKDTLNWLRMNLTITRQFFKENNFYYRDSCMAKNIMDYAEMYPNEKLFVWAHNGHISRVDKLMGGWLQRYFGKEYYPVAIATAAGNYTASKDFEKTSFHPYPLQLPYAGAAEYYLARSTITDFILPLQKDTADKSSSWMNKESYFRGIGFMQMKEQFDKSVLRNEFNAVVFIRNTTHTNSYMLRDK